MPQPAINPLWFIPFFPLLWLGACAMLSAFGGWHALAGEFGESGSRAGEKYRTASGAISRGWVPVNYSGCLIITLNEEGIGLAVWPMFRFVHRPLFIPRSAVCNVIEGRYWFYRSTKLELVGSRIEIRLLGRAGIAAVEFWHRSQSMATSQRSRMA
jgi:hypothetical protein